MKIFAIYFKIVLIKKPEWFDKFRDKYQGTKILHVTLVQPRYTEEEQIPEIKLKISEVLNKYTFTAENKTFVFNKLEFGQEKDGKYTFMLLAEENEIILNLQKDLVNAMGEYNNYCDEVTKQYESNFRPHLTVGVNVEPVNKDEALEYFSSVYECIGEITELVLPVVKDRSVEEADNIENLTLYTV